MRFSPQKLGEIRRRRESQMWSYMASLNIRKGAWKESLVCLKKSVLGNPQQIPELVFKYVLTIADRFL